MLQIVVIFIFVAVFINDYHVFAWDPANFTFNPGDNYKLVWSDEFENVGPAKAIIDGQPAYSPNPNNWVHTVGTHRDGGLENYTDSIENSYVQNGQLNIVAMKQGYQSAMLTTLYLQEFTFGTFAAKIRLPYGRGIWPAWWILGHDHTHQLSWPTIGEIDIVEMWGGNTPLHYNDQHAYATVHWNNQSNTMNPWYNKAIAAPWQTPDGSMLHNNSLVYWTEWTPTNITVGVNEFAYFHLNTTVMSESINPVWAFSGKWPFRLILDIAITSNLPGPPDNSTIWPQKLIVDWVRVYQKNTTKSRYFKGN